jgi:hypothetical protein
MRYATGKFAIAICDVCGFQCKYSELRQQRGDDHKVTGRYVCGDCVDKPHRTKRWTQPDATALRHPRPDTGLAASRRILHWWPVDAFKLSLKLGAAIVETNL